MALAGQVKRTVGPVALTTTLTTNVYNNASALIYDVIKWIYVANKTASAATFSLWLGGTGGNVAGTELFIGVSVPGNTTFVQYMGNLKMVTTDFLVGGSGTATALTITITGEQCVV
jgi:hypothetical protein